MQYPSWLCIAVSLVFTGSSCKQNEGEAATLNYISGSTVNSIRQMQLDNDFILAAFDDRAVDPATRVKAKLWLPKVKMIREYSMSMAAFVKQLQSEENVGGSIVWDSIQKFKSNLLSVDSLITREFSKTIQAFPSQYEAKVSHEDFLQATFPDLSQPAARAYLLHLEHEVRTLENRLLTYCLEHVPNFSYGYFDSYSAIIGQSSSVVARGEEIEIIAGVGAFSIKADPKISIQGKDIGIGKDGSAMYKFKAPQSLGKYRLPVIIEFTDEHGKRQTIKKIIEYQVK